MMAAIHGQWKKKIYAVWRDMKQRCSNPNNKSFKNYGGRGIKVCDDWIEAKNFIDWAYANGYDETLTLDRIDSDKDYCPSNCRWVTMKVQQNNKRNNHFITFNGKTKTIKEWSEETGISNETIRRRIEYGWEVEAALYEPPQIKKKGMSRSVRGKNPSNRKRR